jgi:galactose mutarotase-like enzyme
MRAAIRSRPPSGEQTVLADGDWQLTVVEVGGGMRRLRVRDWEVLDGYPIERMCNGGRGQTLIPWPNRIDGGRYAFDGQTYQLPLTEPLIEGGGNAIHGLVRWGHWRAAERERSRVVLEHTLDPQPGYPFALVLRLEYVLSEDGLRVTTSLTNVGPTRCPFGIGFHPYFSCGDPRVDFTRLRIPANEHLDTNERGIPTGRRPVDGSAFDFRRLQPIGSLALDRAFVGLERDAQGRAWVELASRDERRRIAIWLGEHYRYVQIFTGDTLPTEQRRLGVAVEPMTCPANAFASGEALLVLEPGATWQGSWGITARIGEPGSQIGRRGL